MATCSAICVAKGARRVGPSAASAQILLDKIRPICNNGGMAMAKIRKTEHSGPKKGRGAYYGRKRDAKHESDKQRRANDKTSAREQT